MLIAQLPLHVVGCGSLLACGKDCPYESLAANSVDSDLETRPSLRLLIEGNDNASKETAGRGGVERRCLQTKRRRTCLTQILIYR